MASNENPKVMWAGGMERRTAQTTQYIHKRQPSGSNETAVVGGTTKESSSTSKSVTIISTSQRPEGSPSSKSSTTSSSILFPAVSPATSTKLTDKTSSTTSTTPSQTVEKTLSTAVVQTTSKSSSTTPQPLPTPVTTTTSSLTTTTTTPKQLVATSPSSSSPVPPTPPAPAVVPPVSSIQSIATPSSILIDTSAVNAPTTSIPEPTFAPISSSQISVESLSSISTPQAQTPAAELSTATGVPSGANALQAPSTSAATLSSSALSTGATASGQQSNDLLNSTPPSNGQTPNNTTIIGAAGFVLLALIGIWCIRRRYKKPAPMISPFIKRPLSQERMPISPPAMVEHFKPDIKTLFRGNSSNRSSISEGNTRSSTASSLPPPYRHSRAYTTTVLPPQIPARSSARPPTGPVSGTSAPAVNLTLPKSEPIVSIDASFMGTISTYFSSNSSTSSKADSLVPPPLSTKVSKAESQYTASTFLTSPYSSYMPPGLPTTGDGVGLMRKDYGILPLRNNSDSASTSTSQTPSTRDLDTPGALGTSRFQSMGQWRDSVWSTSATPISNEHGGPSTYFTRPGSHRASRSMGDVLDWRDDAGRRSGDISPLITPQTGESQLPVPPRSPLRAWPLK